MGSVNNLGWWVLNDTYVVVSVIKYHRSLRESIASLHEGMESLKKQCGDLEADEGALESKVCRSSTTSEATCLSSSTGTVYSHGA